MPTIVFKSQILGSWVTLLLSLPWSKVDAFFTLQLLKVQISKLSERPYPDSTARHTLLEAADESIVVTGPYRFLLQWRRTGQLYIHIL